MSKKKVVEKERVTISPDTMTGLSELEDRGVSRVYEEWEFIEDEIAWVDAEGGGGQHYTVVKRLSDGKFFKMDWTDWDCEGGESSGDFLNEVQGSEVTPKTVTKVVYE